MDVAVVSGAIRAGGWCEGCQTSSLLTSTLYAVPLHGVPTPQPIATWRTCPRCDCGENPACLPAHNPDAPQPAAQA